MCHLEIELTIIYVISFTLLIVGLLINLAWLNKSYQMNPANYREALTEMREDESEGVDILLVGSLYYFLLQTCKKLDLQVKPGLPYLDIISLLRDNSPLPIAAYQVLFFAHSSTRKNVSDKKVDQIFNTF